MKPSVYWMRVIISNQLESRIYDMHDGLYDMHQVLRCIYSYYIHIHHREITILKLKVL